MASTVPGPARSGRARGGGVEARRRRRLRGLLALFVLLQPLALLTWRLLLRRQVHPRLGPGSADVSIASAHDIGSVFRRYQAFAHQQLRHAGSALQAQRERIGTNTVSASANGLHTGGASSTGGASNRGGEDAARGGGALLNVGLNLQVPGVRRELHRGHTFQQQQQQQQQGQPGRQVAPVRRFGAGGAQYRTVQNGTVQYSKVQYRLRVRILEAASEQQCLAKLQQAGEEWEQAVHRRRFDRFPIRVQGSPREVREWEGCDVPCHFVPRFGKRPKPSSPSSTAASVSASATTLGAEQGLPGTHPSAALEGSNADSPGTALLGSVDPSSDPSSDPSPEDWVDGFFGFTRQVRRGDGTSESLLGSDAFPLPRGVGTPGDLRAHHDFWPARVHRSMEPAAYYGGNNVTKAREHGVTIVMTVHLNSDVPVPYGSWDEYPVMQPVGPKEASPLAAVFISNCGGHNDRIKIVKALEKLVPIETHGACFDGKGSDRGLNKLGALARFRFSLAFENSCEEDYVTEKFWQSLVAGAVPLVLGAPNVHLFAPSPTSFRLLKGIDDVPAAAAWMLRLSANESLLQEALRWKTEGPSDPFLAMLDLSAVHSSCRLCIALADLWQQEEEELLGSDAIPAEHPPHQSTQHPLHHSTLRSTHQSIRHSTRRSRRSLLYRSLLSTAHHSRSLDSGPQNIDPPHAGSRMSATQRLLGAQGGPRVRPWGFLEGGGPSEEIDEARRERENSSHTRPSMISSVLPQSRRKDGGTNSGDLRHTNVLYTSRSSTGTGPRMGHTDRGGVYTQGGALSGASAYRRRLLGSAQSHGQGTVDPTLPVQSCRCKFPTPQGTPSEVLRVLLRERGRFRFFPIYLSGDEGGVTLHAVLGHVRRHYNENGMLPVWAKKRPPMLRTPARLAKLRMYRLYPARTTTQREALVGPGFFMTDDALQQFIQTNPCSRLEFILI